MKREKKEKEIFIISINKKNISLRNNSYSLLLFLFISLNFVLCNYNVFTKSLIPSNINFKLKILDEEKNNDNVEDIGVPFLYLYIL